MKLLLPFAAILFALFPPARYYLLYYGRLIDYYYDYVETCFASDVSSQAFDFIVVGSGSSGTVVAHRLSQHYKVLLLEAGGAPSDLSSIPGFSLELLGYPEHDWNYKSVPQNNVLLSHTDQQIKHNRGKVLGGCSTLNYMMYLRGHPLDYDSWANSTGDASWTYENLLPYFKKSIKQYNGRFRDNKKHYESSPYGFLSIEIMKWGKMLENFLDAGAELGLNTNIDANGPQTSGLGTIEVSQYLGERGSLYASILEGKYNKNLRVSKYSQATNVKIDASGKAVGVWFYKNGKKYFAKASKEVVLSAGTYDSPKLLMLSGVGPKKELESIGIKPKVDLPVGKNLQDHFGILVFSFLTSNGTSQLIPRDAGLWDFYEYFTKGTGFLTAPNGLTGQMFTTTSSVQGVDWPNMQSFFIPVGANSDMVNLFTNAFSIKKEVFDEHLRPVVNLDGFSFLSILVRPKSKGEVTLADSNPFSDPLIDSRPFSHPDDIKALIEGINATFELAENTNAFRKVKTKFNAKPFSKCSQFNLRSDAYWECYIRHATVSVWHPVGTCKMSRATDPTAVVDPQMRVLGTRGLRVVDSSIQPQIVNANTNAPAILIGEKGADFILEYWANQYLVCDKLEPLRDFRLKKCYYQKF